MRKLGVILLLMGILAVPAVAKASFFDDGRWYMESSQWEEVVLSDAENRGSFVDANESLNWLVNPAIGVNSSARVLASNWSFGLDEDFSFGVSFHYSHTGIFEGDEGGIEMGLFNMASGETVPSTSVSVKASNIARMTGGVPLVANIYEVSGKLPGTPEYNSGWLPRGSLEGMFSASYDAANDILNLSIDDITGKREFAVEQLRETASIDELQVYFSGVSNLASLNPGEAYLENFNVESGSMTPEPISSALFVFGGVAFASRRLLKRNKKA
jgi:hypothetical protein